jgi:hypothetical protein
MSREHRLRKLLQSPHVWRPGAFSATGRNSVPSGYAALDQWLGGGWPLGTLTELLLDEPGVGELRLLLPALAQLQRPLPLQLPLQLPMDREQGAAGWLTWVAPPSTPYAPALMQHGLDVARVLVVHSESQVDALWAMEQALRSQLCRAALGWFTTIDDRSMRRLQLAAEAEKCWAILFRHTRFAGTASPAAVRIRLKAVAGDPDDIAVHVLRNRYGPVGAFTLQCRDTL